MLVKGHVERWISITDIGSLKIKDLPVTSFKQAIEETICNCVDKEAMGIIVGLSWTQNFLAKMLQKAQDHEVAKNQVFSEVQNPQRLLEIAYPSQLETTYGGSAPIITRFWPPTLPEMVEFEQEDVSHNDKLSIIPRSEYISHIKQDPCHTPMPRCLRLDLEPLDHENKPQSQEKEPLSQERSRPELVIKQIQRDETPIESSPLLG